MHTHRFFTLSLIAAVTSVTAMIVSAVLFYTYGPRIETTLFPVYQQSIVTKIAGDSLSAQLILSGYKTRPCAFVELDALYFADGDWHVAIISKDKDVPMITTPTGHQVFGVIRVTPAGEKVRIEVRHQCHNQWQTVSPVGEVKI